MAGVARDEAGLGKTGIKKKHFAQFHLVFILGLGHLDRFYGFVGGSGQGRRSGNRSNS
jgi:hypothetical protein